VSRCAALSEQQQFVILSARLWEVLSWILSKLDMPACEHFSYVDGDRFDDNLVFIRMNQRIVKKLCVALPDSISHDF
jgi:hypothetical protein